MFKRVLAAPYFIWALIFTVIPLMLVLCYSLGFGSGQGLSLQYFRQFFEPVYLKVLWRSLIIALGTTAVCLFVGYPLAMILSGSHFVRRTYLVLLCVLPMWMNVLLRTYAWMTILEKNGVLNAVLGFFGLPARQFLYNGGAVMLGMVYNFLPFMVLPIYAVLIKIDHSLVEAAEDLGADRKTVFGKVILPLSLPGVYSGVIMVFLPAVTTFVISQLLGGGQYTLIGNLIEQQFVVVNNWQFGSAVSIIMMIFILISLAFVSRRGDDKSVVGGGLW